MEDAVIDSLTGFMDDNHFITDLKDILYLLYWQYQEQKKYRINEKNDSFLRDYLESLISSETHTHKFINCHPMELDCRERILCQIEKLLRSLPTSEDSFSYSEYEQLIRLISPKLNTAEYLNWIQMCEGASNAVSLPSSSDLSKEKFLEYFSVLYLYSDFIKLLAQEICLKQSDLTGDDYGHILFLESFELTCEKDLGRGQYPLFHIIEPVVKSVFEKLRVRKNGNKVITVFDEKTLQIIVTMAFISINQ